MLQKVERVISKAIKKLHFRAIVDSVIDPTSSVAAGSQVVSSSMKKHSFCGYDCNIIAASIGSFCSIASNCEIGGADHSVGWISTSPVFNENKDQIPKKYAHHTFQTTKRTTIGNDVWIGAKVLIKSGIKIGNGAVVGMGSVVTKDIPPYEIWAGNPAKCVKKRFSEEIIMQLEEIQWWNFPDDKLTELAIYAKDVPLFIEKAKNWRG